MLRVVRARAYPRIAGVLALAGATVLPATASAAAPKLGSRPLREGMSGPDVRVLQHELTEAGLSTVATGVDDAATTRNVKSFEARYRLTVDGVANVRFLRTLRRVRALDRAEVGAGSARGGSGLGGVSVPTRTTPKTTARTRVKTKRTQGASDPTKVLNNPILAPVKQDGGSEHLGERTLHNGMKGHDVRVLQSYLTLDGYATAIDGQYGPTTLQNVMKFESANNLTPNGVMTYAQTLILRQDVSKAVTASGAPGGQATLNADGTVTPPAGAPQVVQQVIAAANSIIDTPYIYGGGHGQFSDTGYDCSGAVSFALHGGGLISSPEDSTELESWGAAGKGSWITVYANAGHAFVVVGGLAFDTAHFGPTTPGGTGPRWLQASDVLANLGDGTGGYVVRHPDGL